MSALTVKRTFQHVPLRLIDPPDQRSRTSYDEQKMDELVTSIRAHGILQNLVLARNGDRYTVIAGDRRSIAAGRAGLLEVPALVYESRSDAEDAIQSDENIRREDLSVADEAMWFAQRLESKYGGDVDKLAAALGLKRAYVEGRLLLFQGDEDVFHALGRREITIGVAHELNKVTDPQIRRAFLVDAVRGGATVSLVTSWVATYKAALGHTSPTSAPAGELAPTMIPNNPQTCLVCGTAKPEQQHLIVWVPIHQHCKLAILDPLLESGKS